MISLIDEKPSFKEDLMAENPFSLILRETLKDGWECIFNQQMYEDRSRIMSQVMFKCWAVKAFYMEYWKLELLSLKVKYYRIDASQLIF